MEPEIRKANGDIPDLLANGDRAHADEAQAAAVEAGETPPVPEVVVKFARRVKGEDRERSVIRMPSFEAVSSDPVLYAHASRILHLEANPGNARALVQRHGEQDLWLNPPPIPLTTRDMDFVYELPFARVPHPSYGKAEIPAYKMIKFSIAIQRGCFGGCTFCSITEHEGRIIQNRSEASVLKEIEKIRDTVPGFTGVISDLGGPTANMYRIACKSRDIEKACRKPSCVFPGICPNLNTDHSALIQLYRKARALPGVKKILIASGVRYDLAIESPEYVKELATHHVGGYLKIAPEAIGEGPLSKMMKPGVGTYYKFKELFDKFSKARGKRAVPDSVLHRRASGHHRPGHARAGAVAEVERIPRRPGAGVSPVAHGDRHGDVSHAEEPLRKVTRDSEEVTIPKGIKQRRLHKAFLRYHDPNNWPVLREALRRMGRSDLIGNGKMQLVPSYQPAGTGGAEEGARKRRAAARPGRSRPSTPACPRCPRCAEASSRPALIHERARCERVDRTRPAGLRNSRMSLECLERHRRLCVASRRWRRWRRKSRR